MNAAELFIACLEEEGITYIFGVPGEENADFLFALEKSKIEFIMTRHEQGAAFMAEAYGRLTGKPGVCLSTLGPGATNLLTGIADANMDRAPVLAITGQGNLDRLHKESHQIINIENLFEPVTKWSFAIRDKNAIPEIIRKAVKLASSEKPGAVVLELPEDIAAQEVSAQPLNVSSFRRPGPDSETLNKVLEKLRIAKKPLIIAGNGAIRTRASQQLRRFCELTNIGVVSTFMGKGAIDKDDERCLFTIGLSEKDVVMKALDEADLILTIGYDMVEYPPELWNSECVTDVIHIDFLPAEIDKDYQPVLEVVGDIASGLQRLNEYIEQQDISFDYDFSIQNAVREQLLQEFSEYKDDREIGKIKPQKALWDVRKALGPSDILLSGVGLHKMWIARYYHCHEPNTCLIPNGFCSMGMALPGAMGAKIAHPDRNVLAICGDGDFLMNIQEMETASRLKSDITVLIWEDKKYGLIEWKQEREFQKHTELSFQNPEWMSLAKSFGWEGRYVENSEDLFPVLEHALNSQGPQLIVIPIDYSENTHLASKLGEIKMNL